MIDRGLNISSQDKPDNGNSNNIQLRKNKDEDAKAEKRYAGIMVTKTKLVVGAIFMLSGIALGLVIATYNQATQTDPLQNYSLHVIQKNVQDIPTYYLTNDTPSHLILVSGQVTDPDILTYKHPIPIPYGYGYFSSLEHFSVTNYEKSFVISLSEPDLTKAI